MKRDDRHSVLALTLALLCFVSVSWGQGKDYSQRIFFDAKVFTGVPDHPYAEAVAIRGDKIVAVGNLPDVCKPQAKTPRESTCTGNRCFPV